MPVPLATAPRWGWCLAPPGPALSLAWGLAPEVLSRPAERPPLPARPSPGTTHVFTVDVSLAGAAEQLPSQEVPVVLQEGQVEVAEKLHVLVLHPQLLGGVPVDDLAGDKEAVRPGRPVLVGGMAGHWSEYYLGACPFIHSNSFIHSFKFIHSFIQHLRSRG